MDHAEYERIKAFSLEEKIAHSKAIIKEALSRYPGDDLSLAWTGGKDSTTMLWLFRAVCLEQGLSLPTAMFIDEGSVFDEIWELVDKVKSQWNVTVKVARNSDVIDKAGEIGDIIRVAELSEWNRDEIGKIGFSGETFPFEPESLVGNHLMKTVAMKLFIKENGTKALATAIRWDEQEARLDEDYFSVRNDPDHTRVHPILHFTERDIWNTIHKHGIPFCSLYNLGYRSLGARCSTYKDSDIPAWEQDLENTPERVGRGQDKEAVMEQLRTLGYM